MGRKRKVTPSRTGARKRETPAPPARQAQSYEHPTAGTVSAPFEAGEHGPVAVKVIDDRGNELLVVKELTETDT